MSKPTIPQVIAEVEQSVREMEVEAAKPGRGQSLAQLRLERRRGALEIIEWCRDNSELVRAVKAGKGEE